MIPGPVISRNRFYPVPRNRCPPLRLCTTSLNSPCPPPASSSMFRYLFFFVPITSTLVHNSTTSCTDRSTRPQYVLIPSTVCSDRNCAHILVRPIKTRLVLILVWRFKPVTNAQACLQWRTEANVKNAPLLHPHRLKNRLLSPNPLLKMMPHRKTHCQMTLSQRARWPLSMLHMWLLYDPMRGRSVFIPSWFDRTANGIVVELTGYKHNNSYWTPI